MDWAVTITLVSSLSRQIDFEHEEIKVEIELIHDLFSVLISFKANFIYPYLFVMYVPYLLFSISEKNCLHNLLTHDAIAYNLQCCCLPNF